MAGFTNYIEGKLLNHLFGGVEYDTSGGLPSSWYVGLLTVSPTDSTAGTEVSGSRTAYVRKPINLATGSSPKFTVTSGDPSQAVNDTAIEWDAATNNWGTVSYAGIYDASSGGNLICYVAITNASDFTTANPKAVNSGDIFKISAGNLKIRLD